MEFKVTPAEKSQLQLTVELTELEMEKYYHQALDRLSKQVNVKGFRPGKVPRNVVEQQVDQSMIYSMAADLAISPTYVEIVEKEKIEPVGRPSVTVENFMPLKFTALIPITPTVTFKDLQGLQIEEHPVDVKDEEVQAEITRYQRMHSAYTPIEREVQLGDRIEIDFDGYDENKVALENTSSRNHPMILGDKSFVPGFEEQIVGMKKGEKREIKVTFPADYFHEPFRNKVVEFVVRVVAAEEMQVPELTAEFIQKVTGKAMSVDEFKTSIRTNLLKAKQDEEKRRQENDFLSKLLEKVELELPHSLIHDEIDYIIKEQQYDLKSRGIEWKQYLEAMQQTESAVREEKHKEAENRLKIRFAVLEMFKQENITVNEAEMSKAIDDELAFLASMNFKTEQIDPQNLRIRLENRQKMDKLLQKFIKTK